MMILTITQTPVTLLNVWDRLFVYRRWGLTGHARHKRKTGLGPLRDATPPTTIRRFP